MADSPPQRLLIRDVSELTTSFLPWFERKMVEATACSLGEVFAALSFLLSLLCQLREKALELNRLADQHGSAKLVRFAEFCAQSVGETARDFPICLDHAFLRALVQRVCGRAKDLEANFPTTRGGTQLIQDCCRSMRSVLAEAVAAAESLNECTERWAPVLHHLDDLKKDVRRPVEALTRSVASLKSALAAEDHCPHAHSPSTSVAAGAGAGPSVGGGGESGWAGGGGGPQMQAAQERRDKALARMREASNDTVRRVLMLEREAESLLAEMVNLLKPYRTFAALLAHDLHRGDALYFTAKLPRGESERIQAAVRLLADETPSGGARHDLPRGTLRFIEQSAEGSGGRERLLSLLNHLSRSTPSAKREADANGGVSAAHVHAMRSFDTELLSALYSDWTTRLHEQRETKSSPELAPYHAAQEALERAVDELDRAAGNERRAMSKRQRVAEESRALQETVRKACWRTFHESVELVFDPQVAAIWATAGVSSGASEPGVMASGAPSFPAP